MFRTRKALRITLTGVLLMAMLFSSPQSITYAAENADKVSVSLIGKYDSFDTAAIRDIDTVKKQIRFRNHKTGKTYTLSYDNTSMIYDVRGTALSAALLEVGQIVDVKFLKSSKHITSLNVSSEAWTVEDTREHDLVRGNGTAKVKGELYKIDPKTLVMADGNIALAEDVLSTDKVTVSGIGKDIYSVVVTSGHGYVSLSSDTVEDHSLVGSWIELDNEVIYKISPNMLLSAPEGDYTLQILGNGASYTSEVNVSRNQETVVDTSNVNITKPKEGLVTFEIIPDTAEVFVDGEKVLTGVPQSIKYGYHNLKIIADGYKTQNKYLKIGTAKSVISIEMEKDKDDSSDSSSDSSSEYSSFDASSSNSASSKSSNDTSHDSSSVTSASAATTAATVSSNSSEEKPGNKVINGYYIYFDKPYAAELYFDGAYIGMIPTHVPKISGTHEVILKMEGYETKSYRISIDKDEVDLNYTFPDLVKHKSDDEESSSGSSSSAASSASSDDSSSADSASTGDSASGDDSAIDASSAEDTSGEGDSIPSEDSTKESTLPSEDASVEKSSEGTTDTSEELENESTHGNSKKEEAADAASTASASGD